MGANNYDVVIIGAGAAGCAAAIRLPAGVRALLVDRADPATGRCCGGLLAPDGQAAIAAMGLALPEGVRVRPEPHCVHVHDLDSGREQTYRRNYVNLDRTRFDAWLVDLAARRAEFRPHTRFVGAEFPTTGTPGAAFPVQLSSAGRSETVRARLLLAADGAGSLVRRRAAIDPGPPVMLAIQVRVATSRPPTCHEVLFARGLTDYYAWAIPKPDCVLVGAAFGDVRRARGQFESVLACFRDKIGLEGEVVEKSARRLSRPRSRRELSAGCARVLLAGEAAGLVSPSSGEGLSFALESGAAAGEAVAAADPLAAYRPALRRLARRVAGKLLKARVIFSPGWRRLALRIPWCP